MQVPHSFFCLSKTTAAKHAGPDALMYLSSRQAQTPELAKGEGWQKSGLFRTNPQFVPQMAVVFSFP